MKIDVVLYHLDQADVTITPPWWHRVLGWKLAPRRAIRDRFGWYWDDTRQPVADVEIERVLADALAAKRGY